MPEVVRIVGPPGSGKTLLIVSLVEAMRTRGHRVATVVRRESLEASLIDEEAARQLDAGAQASVIVLSSGGRVTIERPMELPGLRDIVASVDPSVDLLLAEGFEDAGYPSVAIVPRDGAPPAPDSASSLAVSSTGFSISAVASGLGVGSLSMSSNSVVSYNSTLLKNEEPKVLA